MDIEFVILADAAQVQGGRLYTLGAGWSVVRVHSVPARYRMALATGILLEPDEMDKPHPFHGAIRRDENGAPELFGAHGEIEQASGSDALEGVAQRALIAVDATVVLDAPGAYVVEVRAGPRAIRSTRFHVVADSM